MKHLTLYRYLSALALAFAGYVAPWLRRSGRHFFLEAGDAHGVTRVLSSQIKLAEGVRQSWQTITRTGSFTDPRYGRFEITRQMLLQMVANFDAGVVGQDIFIDVAHRPGDGAAAKVLKLMVDHDRLRGLMEWTPYGIESVQKRGYAYLSAEFHDNWQDNEQGKAHGCVLLGAGLTTRPVIKRLDPVQLSEALGQDTRFAIHPSLLKHLESEMNPIEQLRIFLLSLGLTEAHIAPLIAEATKQLSAAGEEAAKQLAVVDTFKSAGKTLSEQIKTLGGAPAQITLRVAAPAGADEAAVATAVAKVLAQRDADAATASAALAAKVKILSDAVEADTGLDATLKSKVLAETQGLVNAAMTEEQVKSLSEFVIRQAKSGSAAAQLALLGYQGPSGTVHLSVDSSNSVKSLQEAVDTRLGFKGMADAKRFERTGGQLLTANKAFAEKALAQFDQLHGERLMREHKALAAGVGQISDTALPAVVERTVLRESLYQLVGLGFCDVNTAAFGPTIQIPYSYRDTTAAGKDALRTYELQAIRKAGVIQTYEEARPLPQKLAFQLSAEMRYLLGGSVIDFDPIAENVRNIIRIVGEDTDRLVQNEMINAADEALVVAFDETLTAQVNGSNKVFVTAAFPVVRPRRVYDLKGAQQGSTANPVTVTLNGTVRSEYVAGVSLAAGLYYVADYNLGEWRFVNEAGVLQTPTSGWVLRIQGSQAVNVAKADLYPGTTTPTLDQIAAVYDNLLTVIGGRKVAIENDRNYIANMLLMSGAIDNALGQAKTFQANSSRPGTNLSADGSVGKVKNIPAFNTRAPGLLMGDTRILVGEQANTRFRMLKPFQMQDSGMQQVRDGSGNFVGATENWGDQFVVVHTPTQLKNSLTSVVLYNSAARIARVA